MKHHFGLPAFVLAASLVTALPASHSKEAGASILAARAVVEERGSCNADNLLRLLRTPSNLPQALPFCSSYLMLPGSTLTASTVITTVIDTGTQTVTSTQTIPTTVTDTQTTVSVATVTQTLTLTETQYAVPLKERSIKGPLSETVLSSYDASRISSACGCLTIPIDVHMTTPTASVVTQTSSTTQTVVTTISLTETVQETTSATTTTTTSLASTTTAHVTIPSPTSFALYSLDPATGSKLYYGETGTAVGSVLFLGATVADRVPFHWDNYYGNRRLAYRHSDATYVAFYAWGYWLTSSVSAVIVPLTRKATSTITLGSHLGSITGAWRLRRMCQEA